ncbi:VOC family protein [Mucilaginibacter kameinonensis]|uniref:VOC family protein n=1 Tax=Mucilaginibacter kameinonensis TaxID=452286 RepID=UPI000EF7B0C5|nr:VOC family protein [Mucilaginibacter kameinonensis]
MATKPSFAPQLAIPHGITDISFYSKALGAVELRRFSNDDGSIHVSELSIDGTIFHLHEETERTAVLCPDTVKATSVTIGLFVDDVHAVVEAARQAGAKVDSEVTDWDYGYRQGDFIDPFGHRWMIEKVI